MSALAVIFFGLQIFASVVAKHYPADCSTSESENTESSALPMRNSSLKGFSESLMGLVLSDLNNLTLATMLKISHMWVAFALSVL
jgi:hypothetical protein